MDNVLIAKEGYIYTNGETFADIIRLGCHDKPENWWEITEEEYNQIIEKMQAEIDKEGIIIE